MQGTYVSRNLVTPLSPDYCASSSSQTRSNPVAARATATRVNEVTRPQSNRAPGPLYDPFLSLSLASPYSANSPAPLATRLTFKTSFLRASSPTQLPGVSINSEPTVSLPISFRVALRSYKLFSGNDKNSPKFRGLRNSLGRMELFFTFFPFLFFFFIGAFNCARTEPRSSFQSSFILTYLESTQVKYNVCSRTIFNSFLITT